MRTRLLYLPALAAVTVAATVVVGCGPTVTAPEPLPVHYATISSSTLTDAAAVDGMCDDEEARERAHLAALEGWTGDVDTAGYLRSLDSLYSSINSVGATLNALSSVHPDADLRAAAEACVQRLSSVETDLSLSRPIYEAVAAVDLDAADAAARRAVDRLLLGFRLSGVDRDEATRARIRELNETIVAVGQEFDRNIREDVRYLELESVEDLVGLPDDYVAAHAPDEDGLIRISTRYPDLFPFMEYAERDDLRRALARLSGQRGWPANEAVLRRLLLARHELAQLVGFENYAELVTADKMSGSPERVDAFITELAAYTGDVQDREYAVLLERLRAERPDAERLESWQRRWIQSKVAREQYGVDSREVRRYFNYDNTRQGIFELAESMFGVRIEPRDAPTWHEEVEAFSILDGDEVIGHFYLDMHPREGKYQHAAMFPMVVGVDGVQLPVASLVCNFPRGDEPMQFTQVETFLHEFGHLLHFEFAGHQPWSNISGIATEWDFVEAPSQMLEEWVWDYDTVSAFARDAEGEPLPKALHDAMIAERDFGLGMQTRGQLAYARISLSMYDRAPDELDFDALHAGIIDDLTRFETLPDTHGWASFGHLNGYSAIYYTYQWSLAIATDMFTRFQEAGLRDAETAAAYRANVLEGGGSRPAEELVEAFLGRDISFEPYARRLRGES